MGGKTPYTVKKGDTLWALADKYLNDPTRWKEIWHFNHKQYASPEVREKLKQAKVADNPDLIFIGQQIYLPLGDHHRQSVLSGPSDSGKTPAKDKVRLIPLKYQFEKKVFETYLPGGFRSTVIMNGSITIQSANTVSWAEFNADGFDIHVAKNYETPLNQLVSEFQLGINEKTKEIDFSCGVTFNSGAPLAPKHHANASIDPFTGMPTYATSIFYPKIEGKLNEYHYRAVDYCVSITIEKLPDIARRVPVPILVPQRTPAKAPARSVGADWTYAAGVLLLIGAAAVVIGTVVEDVITGFVSSADEPASFALAAAMSVRGTALLRGGQVAGTRLGGGALAY